MSGDEVKIQNLSLEEHDEDNPNYKPPPVKTLDEIINTDKEDESLRKYKEALLGQATKDAVIVEPNDPRKVIVKKLALLVTGREDMELDLTGSKAGAISF